jgi:hypothetical protein
MYPGLFPPPAPLPQTQLQLRRLDEFSDYLKRHDVAEMFWNVIKARMPEADFPMSQPLTFKPGVYFSLRLTAKDNDLVVVCRVQLPIVMVAAEVAETKAEAERITESLKHDGFILMEGELQTFAFFPLADDDIWAVDEMLSQDLTMRPPFIWPNLKDGSDE